MYVLDALDAYNHKLVKKIEVVGFELKNLKGTDSYIYFAELLLSKDKGPQVRLEIEQQSTTGAIKRIYKKLLAIGSGSWLAPIRSNASGPPTTNRRVASGE